MGAILYTKQNGIAFITLSRPEAMNAINREMNAALWSAWQDFADDPQLDVAILTGQGDRAFCAGADLADYIPTFLELDDQAEMLYGNCAKGLRLR